MPPALSGSQAISAVDRIVRRAMDKNPANRFAAADEMAAELRAVMHPDDSGTHVETRAVKRLIVLPFRVLRSDPETDFLAFSLPDAIAASLAGLSSLVVRSSLAAARFAGAVLDLREIAKEVDVDTVLTGTLLRAGTQLRLTTQLVEAPSATLIWSKASQVELRDVFQLQDTLVVLGCLVRRRDPGTGRATRKLSPSPLARSWPTVRIHARCRTLPASGTSHHSR